MAYTFNDSENKITKLLPAYIFNYSYDNGKGLFRFIKYLTNYIETANEALDTICSELNVNSSNTYILDILAKKLGVEIPTTITSVEDNLFDGGSVENHPTKPKTNTEGHLLIVLLWRKDWHHRSEWCW